jgi:hypothetical protein
MTIKKKLQVFVSSTYQDLREERQAAVEAILSAGHIPAGMELFAAGDQSQMNVIKQWIDESDVFLLILGGRYGSIEAESAKSYIQLEYEYAVEHGKPHFAVVIDDKHLKKKVRRLGPDVMEQDNPSKLKEFRQQLLSNRLVKFWSDPRDIKLAIYEALADFGRRSDVTGWIPGSQSVDTGALAEELARLAKENAELRQQLAERSLDSNTYSGLRFDELFGLLTGESVQLVDSKDSYDEKFAQALRKTAERNGRSEPNLREALWALRERIVPSYSVSGEWRNIRRVMYRLEFYGIVDLVEEGAFDEYDDQQNDIFKITPDGQKFILRLVVEAQRLRRARESRIITEEANAPDR